MGDMLGRKWGLIAACLVFCVGVALQTGTLNFAVFVGMCAKFRMLGIHSLAKIQSAVFSPVSVSVWSPA
jgi:hypothetical protein